MRRTLTACREIPRGRVMTYGALAAAVGAPRGARAVGNAMALNPIALIIPCHRVIWRGGGLGGYGGGLAMKQALLEMEGVAFDRKRKVVPECILHHP
ncbi:MAG: MGMT family protein [Deltaproteobacteria bacterium]|nr:MGMT family protein [Deltaproteobacteria bacterium]